MQPNKLPHDLIKHIPWTNPTNPIWPASTFVLHRNIDPFLFPGKMTSAQMQQTLNFFRETLLKTPSLQSPVFIEADHISPLDKEFLFEHFLCTESFQNTFQGQGFIIDASSRFLATINITDHLQLHFLDSNGNWDTTWNTLSELETKLGSTLNYAFSPRFGYLTADPGLSGTALEVSAYLHLPALSHLGQLYETLLKQKNEDVAGISMEGSEDCFLGDFLIVRNQYTLGLAEETLMRNVYTTGMKMMAAEKTLRSKLALEENDEVRDKVSRAYGLLIHSYQLQTKETFNALSLIKLGIDLGWIRGIEDHKINELFFKCQRAHLAHLNQFTSLDPHLIRRARAELLHKTLQNVSLML